jgi:hypothetical protein
MSPYCGSLPGLQQHWDFGIFLFTQHDQAYVLDPTLSPEHQSFPTAGFCLQNLTVSGFKKWTYFNLSPGSLNELGIVTGQSGGGYQIVKYVADAIVIPFPLNFNDSWTTVRNSVNRISATDSIVTSDTTTWYCDGWGESKLGSKHEQSLRAHGTETVVQTEYVNHQLSTVSKSFDVCQFFTKGYFFFAGLLHTPTFGVQSYRVEVDDRFLDIATTVASQSQVELTPTRFSLMQNHPNPFNPATVIEYSNESYSEVHLDILNLIGEQVYTRIIPPQTPGIHSLSWDGRDNHLRQLPSGVYFYRITSGSHSQSRAMVLLK